MSQGSTVKSVQKVTDIWFEDGNLIVIAGFSVFRLYQGLLIRQSPIFRDILSIPQSNSTTAIDEADRGIMDTLKLDVTGCAVVRLTDKPQEVYWFLAGFLGDSLMSQFSTELSALTGVLRLATKYEVKFLQKWAVECLERLLTFTTDPDPDDLILLMRRGSAQKGTKWMNGMLPLLDLAVTAGVTWLLPGVFWRLQAASLSDILFHPEWKEFPEQLKSKLLLCREYARDGTYSDFALVLRLHNSGASHLNVPKGRDCAEKLKAWLFNRLTTLGPNVGDDISWSVYVDAFGCASCKKRYDTLRREMVIDAFVALKNVLGLPAHAKMMEKREEYYVELLTNV